MEDWKKRLAELGAKVPSGKERVVKAKSEVPGTGVVVQSPAESSQRHPVIEAEMKEKEADETNPDFMTLIRELNVEKGSKMYYRVRDLFYGARRSDIDYDLNRWIGNEGRLGGGNPNIVEIVNKLRKQGYASAAYDWWQSSEPEGMKYGRGTKEMRLQEAEKFALKAGGSLEEIIGSRSAK